MKQKRLKSLVSALILASLALIIFVQPLALVRAASNDDLINSQTGLWKLGEKYGATSYDDDDNSLFVIIGKIINVSLTLLGVLIICLILFSGYQWMTAGGNEDQIKTAKKRMANAVIGLVIVLLAKSITLFIFYRALLPATTGDYYWY